MCDMCSTQYPVQNMDHQRHFKDVWESETLQQALKRNKLDRHEIYREGGYRKSRVHNGGLKLWKDEWLLPLAGPDIEGVSVHYESRHPGQIQLDVEVFPYEGSIEKDKHRLEQLKSQLALKSRVLQAIRTAVASDARTANRFGATTKGLREPSAPSTLCAVKFVRQDGSDPGAETDAAFIADVVEHATAVVDRTLDEIRSTRR